MPLNIVCFGMFLEPNVLVRARERRHHHSKAETCRAPLRTQQLSDSDRRALTPSISEHGATLIALPRVADLDAVIRGMPLCFPHFFNALVFLGDERFDFALNVFRRAASDDDAAQ